MAISLIDNLGTILSGLRTSQQLLNTATRNISNAQTPNYVSERQHSVVNNLGTGGSAAGEVQRIVDESLLQQQRQTTADVNYNQARKDSLAKISALAGDPSQETNLGALVQALGNAFQALAGNPTSPGLTDDVVVKAQALVDELNHQNSAVLTIQRNSLQTMQDQMSRVNLGLHTIADLNAKVNTALALGADPSTLKDQRDAALADLSTKLDIRVFYDTNGIANVYSADYKPLATQYAEVLTVDLVTGNLKTSHDTVTTPGGTLGGLQKIFQGDTVTYLQQLDGFARGLESALFNLTSPIKATVVGGVIAPGNQIVTVKNAALLQLNQPVSGFGAGATITAINTATGEVTITSPAGATVAAATSLQVSTRIPLFNSPSMPAGKPPYYSGGISLNQALITSPHLNAILRMGNTIPSLSAPPASWQPTDALGASGAATQLSKGAVNFNHLAGVTTPVIGQYGTFLDAANAMAVAAGQNVTNTDNSITTLNTYNTQISQSIGNQSGVNIDVEMSNLVILQNLYSSNARVMSVSQTMLDALMSIAR
ncbi:MAG: flagellar basal body rod C-terminal domain-containing protein [Candidatus Pacebacteria bacterium]|nr:flagellar basal body rod C-terminal domain-containing protein [Candidatus Paceibacterota bacterium]